ncbi:MAG: antibiotic biosynthesis monooxygenase [Oscillospiraceae bacterium]|jgi:quinol monooxygenase YgiN|nr:antibiotic biosynthesis monooxygenase [Oscillospiraceae bacterium]
MSIKVVANDYIAADKVETYLALAKQIVAKTNANDKGCISYQLYSDINDPVHFAMIEEWEDQESLDAHMKSPHFVELIPQLGACSAKEGGIAIYKKAF